MVIEVFLGSLDLPFKIWASSINLLGTVELSSTLDEPIRSYDSASMSAITAETAIAFLGEVQESLS